MKRINRPEKDLLSELKDQGLTRKEIAASLGIATRTLSSYAASFGGYRGNKNNRTPPKKVVDKLRRLSQSMRVRTTKEIDLNKLFEVYVNYKITTETSEGNESNIRDKIMFFPAFELEELTNQELENTIKAEIEAVYVQYGNLRNEVEIINWTIRKELNM